MPISMCRPGFRALPLCLLAVILMPSAHAAGMVPQTPVLVVDEGLGEATMNVRNTESRPALLHTTVVNIEPHDQTQLLFSPSVTRVEAGAVQQVRFILQSAEPLQTERLKRVIFEGINPVASADGARVNLGVRQNLPVILRPAGLPVEREPWHRLSWSATAEGLLVSNPSPYVVRLAKAIVPLPGTQAVDLPRTWILPGERLSVALPLSLTVRTMGVRIFPATTYGFAVDHFDAPVTH
ncbi:fimbrial chaperone protein [Pseudomonas sp. MWU12-2115]|uniref:fimbria/pilus chaperone family protein n=1 Tax=unclassified Pseudomonas TaxID=196821 RepID=UPI000CD4DCBE|nr:fimbria/pilus chaperone family protein [Pseudomonas sp. MWU12-2020]RBC02492.1 fimbrial chaperone protein [Pseudomonas sp. MWU12-2115]